MNKLSETRMKLSKDIHLVVPNGDTNQIAIAVAIWFVSPFGTTK